MTSVPDDPVSVPPKDTPSTDPSVPMPAEADPIPADEDDELTEDELERGRAAALQTELPPEPEGADEEAHRAATDEERS
jgi:hypothetical protein